MKLNSKKTLIGVGIAGTGIIFLTGCGFQKYTEPFKDAPTSGHDGTPAEVIEMPDGFSNLSTKCVGGIRYTVIYHGDNKYGSVSVVPGPNNGCQP